MGKRAGLLLILCAGCRTEPYPQPEVVAPPDAAVGDASSAVDLGAPIDSAVAPDLARTDLARPDLTLCGDQDGDGYTTCDGDCDDLDPLINPGAKDIGSDGIDYDCDGKVTVDVPCDGNLPHASDDPIEFAGGIDICPDKFFVSATWATLADPAAHQIAPDFGMYPPRNGAALGILSTGRATDEDDVMPDFYPPQPGTVYQDHVPNPYPMGKNCGGQDASSVNDLSEFRVVLRVPTNAKSFAFDFDFFSAEYPEFVCLQFNDKFLALLDSKQFKGNVSFDGKGNPITVNNSFFTVTDVNQLKGTGYELDDGFGRQMGGSTGWLTTVAPVVPGETITLRFIIFDEGDHIYDSAVLIDHFRWLLTPTAGPHTHRDGGA